MKKMNFLFIISISMSNVLAGEVYLYKNSQANTHEFISTTDQNIVKVRASNGKIFIKYNDARGEKVLSDSFSNLKNVFKNYTGHSKIQLELNWEIESAFITIIEN